MRDIVASDKDQDSLRVPNNQRNSNLELLRILSMLLIIIFHFNIHTTLVNNNGLDPSTFLMHAFSISWGETAVLVFIIITGYFMIRQSLNKRKILMISLETVFYSVVITLIGTATGIIDFNGIYAIEMIFPIISTSYWFLTYYVVLLLLSPYLNKILNAITKSQYILLMTLLIFLTICLRIIPVTSYIFGSYIISFVLAYLIGGYFRLYPSKYSTDKKIGIALLITCTVYTLLFDNYLIETFYHKTVDIEYGYWPMFVLMIVSATIFLLILLSKRISNKMKYLVFFSIVIYFFALPVLAYTKQWSVINEVKRPDCGLCLIFATSLFMIFSNMKPRYNKVINWISASTLSVYIIHESNVLRKYIWDDIVRANEILSAPLGEYLATMILSALAIFSICVIIDKVRIYLLFKPLNGWIEKYLSFIERKIDDITDSLDK